MHNRIGSLQVNYRMNDAALSALTPALDRAIGSQLAESLGTGISRHFGEDDSVVVIRELRTAVTLAGQDALLDSRAVERLSRASLDALAKTLTREHSGDLLVRFADESEFVGSFIVELLDGRAWDHWYFGAFRRHRGPSHAHTIRAVLADVARPARLFAWLVRRGRLQSVLQLVGAEWALGVAIPRSAATERLHAGDGAELLADAAFRLLAALGIEFSAEIRAAALRRFLKLRSGIANWRDRRSLSVWVWRLMRSVVAEQPARGDLDRLRHRLRSVHALLSSQLDWLDGEWLESRIADGFAAPDASVTDTSAHSRWLLTPPQSRFLEHLALQLRAGALNIPQGSSAEAIQVWLLAAISEHLPAGVDVDVTVREALACIARIHAPRGPGPVEFDHSSDGAHAPSPDAPRDPTPIAAGSMLPEAALERFGKAATELLAALRRSPESSLDPGESSAAGALFLLIRALLDTRLPALAHEFEIPLAPLLAGLAARLVDLATPFDAVAAAWSDADGVDAEALESRATSLESLNEALLSILASRPGFDAAQLREKVESDAASMPTGTHFSATLDRTLARTVALLLRAWAFWLRGLHDSSAGFLIDGCLRRGARVRLGEAAIEVELDPAPLDVVLRMAGYFERIQCVPWLAGRSVIFSVRSR